MDYNSVKTLIAVSIILTMLAAWWGGAQFFKSVPIGTDYFYFQTTEPVE